MSAEEVAIRLAAIDAASATLRKIRAEVKGLTGDTATLGRSGAGIDNATRSTLNWSGAFKDLRKNTSGLDQSINHMTNRAAVGIAALTGGAVAWGLKTASSYELSRTAFGALLGDVAQGNALFSQLQTYAIGSPFDTDSIASSVKMFLAAGLSAEKSVALVKGLGDVAAYSSGDQNQNLQGMSRQMAQIAGKGQLYTQDIQQMTENGFTQAWQVAAEVNHRSVGQLRRDMETGMAVPATAFLAAVETMNAKALASMKGGAAEQNKTLSGQWNSFKEQLSKNLAKGVQPGLPEIKKELPVLAKSFAAAIKEMGPVLPGLVHSMVELAPAVTDLVSGFADLLSAVAPVVSDVADLMGPTGIKALLTAMLAYRGLSAAASAITTFSSALKVLRGVEAGGAGAAAATAAAEASAVRGGPKVPSTVPGGGGLLGKLLGPLQIGAMTHLATRHRDKNASWYDVTQGVLPDWIPEPHPTTWLGDTGIKGWHDNTASPWVRGLLGMTPHPGGPAINPKGGKTAAGAPLAAGAGPPINVGEINVHNPSSNVDVAEAVRQGIEDYVRGREGRS